MQGGSPSLSGSGLVGRGRSTASAPREWGRAWARRAMRSRGGCSSEPQAPGHPQLPHARASLQSDVVECAGGGARDLRALDMDDLAAASGEHLAQDLCVVRAAAGDPRPVRSLILRHLI